MASDPTLAAREAIVTHLRADASVTAKVPAGQLHGERTPAPPTWPFVRYGVSDFGQVSGTVTLHVFSKSEFTDEAAGILAALVASLDGKTLALGDGRKVRLSWPEVGGSQIIPDAAEASAWHGIARFNATVARECVA